MTLSCLVERHHRHRTATVTIGASGGRGGVQPDISAPPNVVVGEADG